MKLKQKYDFSTTVTGLAVSTIAFRGNSVFDPDPLLGGSSATMYSVMAQLYKKYRVLGSKIKVRFRQNAALDTDVGIFAGEEQTAPGLGFSWQACPNHVMTRLAPWTVGTTPTDRTAKTLQMYRSTKKIIGFKSDDSVTADAASNPARQWYWTIGFRPSDLVPTSGVNVWVTVEITYYTKWSEPDNTVSY